MIKFERKPLAIAQSEPVGVFHVRKFEKSEPFHDSHFKLVAQRARQITGQEKKGIMMVSHLDKTRSIPI